ncbi:MAG TPA: Trp biosynthesis-associated membrane protein [Nocardioides sp.]|nr:Trp biosynthesis-associated membrane protein [Nocardioides sp.]
MADVPRRTFGPVVLLGIASAGLAALAGSRAWVGFDVVEDPDTGSGGSYSSTIGISLTGLPEAPLVAALAFVVLAAWGVLLVTRGRVRRGMALLAAVASAGMLAAAVVAFVTSPDSLRDTFAEIQVPVEVQRTAWPWLGVAASFVALLAAVLAWRLVPSWPEMGTRFDAPGSTPPPREETSLDLWRALDHGRDPTLPDDRPSDP